MTYGNTVTVTPELGDMLDDLRNERAELRALALEAAEMLMAIHCSPEERASAYWMAKRLEALALGRTPVRRPVDTDAGPR